MQKGSGVFANGLTWFGAAVSIAEIEAGCSIGGNWTALLAGHLLGGLMLFGAGLLGATSGRNAMETTTATFGPSGMRFFAALNLVQLVGWTAVMVAQGGTAVSEWTCMPFAFACLGLSCLVGLWMFIAFGDRLHLAALGMGALAVLSAVTTWKLMSTPAGGTVSRTGFRTAFEISAAMPLSWLPLISDYTSKAKRPYLSTTVSAVVYTLASLWMYALGMRLAQMGTASAANGIARAGLGAMGLAVIVFSTVTTTFLDAYSSGESARSLSGRASPRGVGLCVCAVGGILAASGILDRYIDFLYFISSVFAPMATVLLVDRYLVKRGRVRWNLASWLLGFAAYHLAGSSPAGPTLTSIAASSLATLAQKNKWCQTAFGRYGR